MKITVEQLNPMLEGIKQFIRIGVLATIPVVIEQLGKDQINWRVVVVAFVIAILSGVEKAYHEKGKETGDMNPISKALELKSLGE